MQPLSLALILACALGGPAAAQEPPLRIFLAAGQSNMEGPGSAAELEDVEPALLEPRDDVWCVYAGRPAGPLAPGFGFRSGNFGPELKFGHVVGDALEERVVILKSAIGGTSLHVDWRPPGAVARAGGAVGPLYRSLVLRTHALLEHLDEVVPGYAGQGYELAGVIWMQGESDCPPERAPHYRANLTDFIADLRADLGVPELPFVIGQINDSEAWDGGDRQGPLVRAAQAAVAREVPGTALIRTLDLDPGYHYDSRSHVEIGARFAAAALALCPGEVTPSDARAVREAGRRFRARELAPRRPDPAPLREGLHAYWPFDEGAGSETAGRWPGSLRGGARWKPGLFGSAVALASGDTVVFPGYGDPVDEGGRIPSLSISFWIQTPRKGGGDHLQRFDRGRDSGAGRGWRVRNYANESWAAFAAGTGAGELLEARSDWGGPLMHGDGFEWHHVAAVFDAPAGRMSVWVDDVEVPQRPDSVTSGILPGAGPLTLGGSLHGAGNWCAFDELALWSRALTRAEVSDLYDNGNGLRLLESDPVPALSPVDQLPARAELPDPFTFLDGTRVETPDDWYRRRRPELKRLFQHYVYGYAPPPVPVEATTLRSDDGLFGGRGRYEEVALTLRCPDGEAPALRLALFLPADAEGPVPLFLGLNKCGNSTVSDHPGVTRLERPWVHAGCRGGDGERGAKAATWCVEAALARGYGLATLHVADLDPDRNEPGDGLQAHFPDLAAPDEARWGTLAAWAFGLSRCVDFLVAHPGVDPDRIGVIGHSRRGKAALLAAALDERIGLVVPHQSGTGGCALSRNNDQETVERITRVFPHWFNGTFPRFGGREERLPVDQHLLVALVAPRPLIETVGLQDTWANYESSLRGLRAADAVWKFLGARGMVGELSLIHI